MGKNAKKKNNRNTKRPKGSYQTTDDGDDHPTSPGRGRKNTRIHGHMNNNHNVKPKFNFPNEDEKLRKTLEGDGFEIVEMSADGNCLFRSLSDQLFGDYGNAHFDVRTSVCDYMENHKADFQVFLVFEDEEDEDQDEEDARDFEHYIETMRHQCEWGGNLEIVAAARLYQRSITVYSETLAAFTIDHGYTKSNGPDLLISYHDNEHYNSVRNKLHPPKPIQVKPSSMNGQGYIKTDQQRENKSSNLEEETTSLSKLTISVGSKETEIPTQKNVKRSAPCPCGSGLRYKKCCLAKQKQATRMEKLKATRQEDKDAMSDVNDKIRSPEIRVVAI